MLFYRVYRKKITHLVNDGIKSMQPIFKAEMMMYQSKANLDVKFLFGKVMLVRVYMRTRKPSSIL